jgi:hypothetical protein
MPETLFLGHVLIALGAVAAFATVAFAAQAMRWRREGRGTPGYARGRTARRSAGYALLIAVALAIACYTPLGMIVLYGGPS